MSRSIDSILEEVSRLTGPPQEGNCTTDGHRYRVHGRIDPTRISCGRCEESWGIGCESPDTGRTSQKEAVR